MKHQDENCRVPFCVECMENIKKIAGMTPQQPEQPEDEQREAIKAIYNQAVMMGRLRTGSPITYFTDEIMHLLHRSNLEAQKRILTTLLQDGSFDTDATAVKYHIEERLLADLDKQLKELK